MTHSSRSLALDAVARACVRATSKVRIEMKRGTTSLASVASTAPFFGIMGTVIGIMFSSRGLAGDRVSVLAALAWELSKALVPTALGVLVALLAYWSRKCLLAKLNDFNVEMKTASLELINELSRFAP